MVFVAGAASEIADNSTNWVLNSEDKVINVLLAELFDSDPLPANLNPPVEFDCILGYCLSHSFKGYLDNYEEEIYDRMANAFHSIEEP